MDTLSRTWMKLLARLACAGLVVLALSCVLLAGSASPAQAAELTLENAKGSVGISSYYYGEVRAEAGSKGKISNLACSNDKVVRIRAFNKVGSKTYYGAWSTTKTVVPLAGVAAG